MGPADVFKRGAEVVGVKRLAAENGPGGRALFVDHGQQQVLGRDVRVAQLLGLRVRPVEDPIDLPTEARLRTAPGLGREAGDLPLDRLPHRGHVEPGLLEQRLNHAFVLGQQRGKQVGVVHDRVAPRCAPARRASRNASCALMVNRSGRIIVLLTLPVPDAFDRRSELTLESDGGMARAVPQNPAALAAEGTETWQPEAADGCLFVLPRRDHPFWAIIFRVNRSPSTVSW